MHGTAVLFLLASSLMRAQLVLENPKHLDVPEQQAQVLFLTTNRVVEAEFHPLEHWRTRFVCGLFSARRRSVSQLTIHPGTEPSIWRNGTKEDSGWPPCDSLFSICWVPTGRSACSRKSSGARTKLHPLRRDNCEMSDLASPIPDVQNECIGQITNAAVRGVNCRPVAIVPRTSPAFAAAER